MNTMKRLIKRRRLRLIGKVYFYIIFSLQFLLSIQQCLGTKMISTLCIVFKGFSHLFLIFFYLFGCYFFIFKMQKRRSMLKATYIYYHCSCVMADNAYSIRCESSSSGTFADITRKGKCQWELRFSRSVVPVECTYQPFCRYL